MRTIAKYILIFWIPLISGKTIILDGNLDEPEWESAFVIDEYYEVCLLYTSDAADDTP